MLGRFPQTIAIVGSGFSGTATAVHLLRRAHWRPLRILLVERNSEFGRGLAYARTGHPYLLNVPASRMSATVSDPDEFLRFAQRHVPEASGEDFLPRSLYGDYLQDRLRAAAEASSSNRLEYRRGEVIEVTAARPEDPITLTLADGSHLRAHEVVLALGNPLPQLPQNVRCTARWPEFREDPWTEGKRLEGRGPLLIIGTGLTMVDVVCAAVDRNPTVAIHAISRHGLIPPTQTAFHPDALEDDGGILALAGGSTRRLAAAIRRLAREAEQRGKDWREVVALVRRQVPALWHGLSTVERARFLRHARTYWDIHRHRVPAAMGARIDELRATGRLSVHAGRLVSLEADNNQRIRATWLPRGSNQTRTLDAEEVVDCTGPDYNVTRSQDPLWRSLFAQGLAVPDELRLGIRTGPWGALIGRDGQPSRHVFYVGPMLRADHWEATAVGELRVHAEGLAQHLLERQPMERLA